MNECVFNNEVNNMLIKLLRSTLSCKLLSITLYRLPTKMKQNGVTCKRICYEIVCTCDRGKEVLSC